MLETDMKNNEITLDRCDIDFSPSTVSRLKKTLLTCIDEVSMAICETPQTFKAAIEKNSVELGSYEQFNGKKMIYIRFNHYDYVIPCRVDH